MQRDAPTTASVPWVPPDGTRKLMPRDHLMARLMDARRLRCVAIEGPAGSGKTSTLVAWRRTLLTLNHEVAWLSMSADDNEPLRFFDSLIASLAEVDAAIVKDAELLMGRDSDASAIEHWVITVVQGLARHRHELVLMIDDVHHLTDVRTVQALQCLLDYLPAQVHMALASRAAPPVSLARLRSNAQLAEFDLRDLRFTAEESEAFLCRHLGGIDQRDAAAVHELTDGWVAGLQLFAVDMKSKKGSGYERVEVRDARAFAGYFEREVVARLDRDDLELLTRLAICNRFCAALCATLMGQPGATARMMIRLARLEGDALFISLVSSHSSDAWYRLHPLLREVLLARWASRPPTERRALHARAWHWFDDNGQVDEAVRHAVQADDPEAAAVLVEQCSADMLARGDLGQLSGLLRRLPLAVLRSRMALRLTSARLELYARDLDAFVVTLSELERDSALLDPSQRNVITLLRGGLALHRDDSGSLATLVDELQGIPDDDDDQNVTGRANILSWMHMYSGKFELARQVLADGAGHTGSPRSSLLGECLRGMAHELEGQIIPAERIFRDVLREAEARGAAFIRLACMAAGLLGDTLYESNDADAAIGQLEGRIDLLERVAIPDTVLRALLVLSNAHWLGGRRLEAQACLDRLEDYSVRNGLHRLRSHALALRVRWRLEQGDISAATHALEALRELARSYKQTPVSTLWEVVLNAGGAEVDMLMHRRDLDAAAMLLESLLARAASGGRWRRVASLRIRLASCEARRGRDDAARQELTKALQLGHRLGLLRTLLDASTDVLAMVAALPEGSVDPVIAFYARRLADTPSNARAGAGRSPSRTDAVAQLSDREREVLGFLTQAIPNKKMARVMGISPETVKWHLKNVYLKLGVTSRDEAVSLVRDVGMTAPPAVASWLARKTPA